MAGIKEALEHHSGPEVPAPSEQSSEPEGPNWAFMAMEEITNFPLNLPQAELEALGPIRKGTLPLIERQRRFKERAEKIWGVAGHFNPQVLEASAANPYSGLCRRAVKAIKTLPIYISPKENWSLLEILGAPAKLKNDKVLEEKDLGFLPETIITFLKAASLDWQMKERGSRQELATKQTIITEELGIWFLAWRLALTGGSIKGIAEFLEKKLTGLRRNKPIEPFIMNEIFGRRSKLPLRIERFSRNKDVSLPPFGWDESPDLACALAICCVFKLPLGRFGISFQGTLGKENFDSRRGLLKMTAPKTWEVTLTSHPKKDKVFISFGSCSWLAFLLSQSNFSAAVDLTPAQKLRFLETAIHLLASRSKQDTLYLSAQGPNRIRFRLAQEVLETAISLGFPFSKITKKVGCGLRVPWNQFQSFAESGDSPRNWYKESKAERYFLALGLHLHQDQPTLKALREQGRVFSERQMEEMRRWRRVIFIPSFLYPYFNNLYGSVPRAKEIRARKEAISFISQIFFRHGEEVIWALKRRFPQTSLPDLARIFVETDRKVFGDLTRLPLAKLINWKSQMPKAIDDWQKILAYDWKSPEELKQTSSRFLMLPSWHLNLEVIEDLGENLSLGNLIEHLQRIGIPNEALSPLIKIIEEHRDVQVETIIWRWLKSLFKKRGGKKKISRTEVVLCGLNILERAARFYQGIAEYRLLQVLGEIGNNKGWPSYQRIGFSSKQLAEHFFAKASNKAELADDLATGAKIIATNASLSPEDFNKIGEQLEAVIRSYEAQIQHTIPHRPPLKFIAGEKFLASEGPYCSLHPNNQSAPCIGKGLEAYKNHQWTKKDEIPYTP